MTADDGLPVALAGFLASIQEPAAQFPAQFVRDTARTGLLGALVPREHGGLGLDYARFGELNRAVAERSPSLQSLFTVHGMVCRAVSRWGQEELRKSLLPDFADGTATASFALSEENAGSDVRRITTTARPVAGGWELTGRKRWVTFGETADLFLVFATSPAGPVAVLVRRDDPGLRTRPAPATSGFRGSRLADVELAGCHVPAERLLGRPGTALSHIAADALIVGRLSVAFGAWGLARAALSAATGRAIRREQFDGPLHRLQLVRGLLADSAVAVDAAELLCRRAARALDDRNEWAVAHVLTAKLAASRAASAAAATAAQLHGAEGLVAGSAVDRHVADARVMEIIEGSTQLLQHLIAEQQLARFRTTGHIEPPPSR
ncbi:acyl-CoA dehydrogenase family protein [Dactylosporangium sp. NBC_01737]|uniref:acyl-CoA dehydrogenase family protein n=1 Tax=Dactylosporangium sp. NBC_01737 TaxID=2975959 RepID=UPI002E141A3C|nr:acyl-CoA dehydrogenase family protein [Dactylosporangium sp. NBC_01737]